MAASVSSGAARLRLILGEPAAPPPDWDDDWPGVAPPVLPTVQPSTTPAIVSRWLETYGAARCLLAVLLVVALVGIGGGYLAGRHQSAGTADSSYSSTDSGSFPSLGASTDGFDSTNSSSTDSTTASPSSDIVVDIAGKVAHPGLVTLAAGSRIADAISAAGGIRGHVAPGSVNLAAKVEDGQLIVIGGSSTSAAIGPSGIDTGTNAGTDGSTSGPLDLNTATETELEALPGIGPVLAGRIFAFGQAHSGFTSVSELQQVSGIGPSHFSEIETLVTT